MPEDTEIKLSKDEEERLMKALDYQIGLNRDFRRSSEWDELHESYWQMHFCEPKHENKIFPWPGCSNLASHLVAVADYAIQAQEYDARFANDPFMELILQSDADPVDAIQLNKYYTWFYRNVINLRTWGSDFDLENIVDGTACAKVRQNMDFIIRRRERIVEQSIAQKAVEGSISSIPGFELPPETEFVSREEAVIERIDQAIVESVGLSRIYMAPDTTTSLQYPDCRNYFQEQNLTWDDLVERRRHGYKVPEELKAQLAEHELDTVETKKREREGTSPTVIEKTVQVTEHYMRWPLPGRYRRGFEDSKIKEEWITQGQGNEEGYAEEVVVTYCQDARAILRIKPLQQIYPLDDDGMPHRPHELTQFRRIPRYPYGIGIPSLMKYLWRAWNSFANMGADFGTLTNMPFGFYNPVTMGGALPEMTAIRPGMWIPTLDPRGANAIQLRSDPNFFLGWLNKFETHGERISNVSDVQLGRNPSTPNAQRTARGMAMQVQQGQIGTGQLISQHSQVYLNIIKRIHALKKRYAPPETQFTMRDPEGKNLNRETIRRSAFDIPVEFDIILNPNRQGDQQTIMQLLQLFMQIPLISQDSNNVRGWRAFIKQAYDKVAPSNKMPFDRIWPEPSPIPVGPPPGMPTPGGSPQPGAPRAGTNPPPQPPTPGQPVIQQGGMPPELAAVLAGGGAQ